ncbi:hypothetical protein PVL29_001286 [Vitis rotundifolia]|uniref:Protein Iojap-related, mitochondrial n=1 Tax=Vitis rotundifolia TaxID=103349 RepID=A0AA39AR40_VITRO|nr:hypothetical protein PVL29_001286 [Vitis rotundifolia]
MLAALRSRALLHHSSSSSFSNLQQWKLGFLGLERTRSSSSIESNKATELLNLQEIEQILSDVKADDIRVIPVRQHCDFMVIATGRSTWHVKNIAQALIYKAKQKQKGAQRISLPSVEGQEGGKWVVIDSGTVIVHALDEKARAYYNLESLWTTETSPKEPSSQELENAFVKIRPKNNSKKSVQMSS